MTKSEAWRDWWKKRHGNNQPMGGYHPLEGYMYDAFEAGWNAARLPLEGYLYDAFEEGWNAALAGTCPPCNGNCNQGRTCPAQD